MLSTHSSAEAPPTRRPSGKALIGLAAASVAVAVLALAAILAAGNDSGDGRRSETPAAATIPGVARVGQPAPEFTLTSLEGDRVRLSDFRGTPVLVNFWASWCLPCRQEFPLLRDALEESARSFAILGVVYEDLPRDARAFMRANGATWPALEDPGGRVARAYGVLGIPQTFFVDGDGIIRDRVYGITSRSALEEPLQALLAT